MIPLIDGLFQMGFYIVPMMLVPFLIYKFIIKKISRF